MKSSTITREIELLPPEAKKQVIDFLAFIRTRYSPAPLNSRFPKTDILKEPFIGMWKNREDMKDSAAWVRSMRKKEWEPRL